ncbi:hypothetical protein [Kocuria sp. CH-021]|uniref:hypothetical protein n=1 Tax=Kocuria sp. CH-021 TaxID=3406735 RepID=UPI003C71F28A
MDPVSLVVAALIVGANKSLEGVAEDSLKDAYAGLKGLVQRFFADRPVAKDVLEKSETAPQKYEPVLKDYVEESGAAQDTEVQEAAQKLMALADPEGTRNGQYNTTISGSIHADRGGVAGVHMNDVQAGFHASGGGSPDPH